ncbi:MAG: hypothetical protein IH600_05050 [Bacteroidetes bacterium]|nr:hypothetical protein [Bacteroidota bacterium]
MNTVIRLFAAWILPCILLTGTVRAQQAANTTVERHLVTTVVFDHSEKTATVEVELIYPARLSLSLQNEDNRTILRIALNKQLEAGTHSFTFSTADLKSGNYIIRAQDGSDVQTQKITVR